MVGALSHAVGVRNQDQGNQGSRLRLDVSQARPTKNQKELSEPLELRFRCWLQGARCENLLSGRTEDDK